MLPEVQFVCILDNLETSRPVTFPGRRAQLIFFLPFFFGPSMAFCVLGSPYNQLHMAATGRSSYCVVFATKVCVTAEGSAPAAAISSLDIVSNY